MLCFGHMFVDYVARIGFMYGPSMLPTFAATGDVVLEDRISVLLGRPFTRGDLITFISPANPSHIVCKRILGLPGDVVCVDPTGTVAPSDEHVIVPRGHIWVQGDNADNSRDSRYYGPLSMGLVRGFVYARIWPFGTRKIFRGERNTTYLD
ncbi:signal peptidase I family protein [Peniophora sp. CONT]|nr:signal peptidase I family protein [Peniophora sp. CONT]